MKEGREENIDLLKEWTNPNVWCSTLFLSFQKHSKLFNSNQSMLLRPFSTSFHLRNHTRIHKHNAHTGFTLEEWEMERTIFTLYQWRDHTRREKMLFISLKWLSLLDCMMVHATMNLNMVRTKILKQCHLYQIVIFLLWKNIILVF